MDVLVQVVQAEGKPIFVCGLIASNVCYCVARCLHSFNIIIVNCPPSPLAHSTTAFKQGVSRAPLYLGGSFFY